jgi:antitoxin (DNA-binding transcriptional repressor) of toxin-antitoxin stability system
MITATISDTKNRLSELLARVQAGETLIILDRKTPVARVERMRHTSNNPHIEPALSGWKPKKILELPILAARQEAHNLVDAVRNERAGGW